MMFRCAVAVAAAGCASATTTPPPTTELPPAPADAAPRAVAVAVLPDAAPVAPPDAAPLDPEHATCARFAAALRCTGGAERRHEIKIVSERGRRFCHAWCEHHQMRDGDDVVVSVDGGTAHDEHHYTAGVPDGDWRSWDRVCLPGDACLDRRLRSEEHYRRGKRHGVRRVWHDTGVLAERSEWSDGEPRGIHEEFSPEGILVARMPHDAAGLPDGEWCYWREDARPLKCSVMAHGTGTLREFLYGALVAETAMRGGKRNGRVREWGGEHAKASCLTLDAEYRDDVLHGRYRETNCEHGARARSRKGEYCHGEQCGSWTDRDGNTKHRYRYDDHGDLLAEAIVENGHVVSSVNYAREMAKERRAQHALCLRALKAGGCCDPEQDPPRNAPLCKNGQTPNPP